MSRARHLEFPYIPEQYRGYVDVFSKTDANKEPIVLEDGTSVLFPQGWTDEDADKWRKSMNLQQSEGVTARTYFN